MKYCVVILVFLHFVSTSPVKRDAVPPPPGVMTFMKQYGYLKKDKETSAALYTEEGMSEVIKTVQRFGALKETGKLDNATMKLMSSPRCGNPDVIQGKRSKRFTFGSKGWNKRHITYYIANWSSRLSEESVARLIGKALNTWGGYGGLEFTRKRTPDADIIVSFARGAHNDPFPFDGPGYVLAHAYFPNEGSDFSGDIHFDDDEDWVESGPQELLDSGTDFYTVALHELGHSLGIGHSNDPNAIMFPYYRGDDPNSLRLGQDDIMAMYQLYIVRPITESTQASTPERTPPRRTRPEHTRPTTVPRREETHRPTTRYPQTPFTFYPSTTPRYTQRTTWYTAPDHRAYQTETNPTRERGSTWYKTSTNQYPYTERSTTFKEYDPYTGRRTTERGYNYATDRTTSFKEYPYTPERTSTQYPNRFPYSTNTDYSVRTKEYSDPRTPSYRSSISPTSTSPPTPDLCRGTFDAVANLRGEMFVFKDQYIWRFKGPNELVPGYPTLLRQMFPALPENVKKIDAAYQRPDGNMILFSGDQYWVYDGRIFTENSPRYITDYGIPARTGGIDAIQTWQRNGKTYLFKGGMFWRYNETNKTVDPGYPAAIETRWRGVPKDLDTAMTWTDGTTYFLKGSQYWKLDNQKVLVTPDSPRSFTKDWLGCS